MNTITPPQRGDLPRASWAQAVTEAVNSMLPFAVPGRLVSSGFGGSGSIPAPENKRQHQSQAVPLPFTVKWAAELNDGDGAWIIWLASGDLLTVGDESLNVAESLEAVEGYADGWYLLSALDENGGELRLVVSKDEDGEVSASFEVTSDDSPDGQAVLGQVTIAVASSDHSVQQCVTSAVVMPSVLTDGDSIDANGGEDENALQLAHFADSERDSGKGLASRLSVKDGEITAEDDGLMLVARKDGKLIYIPMSGDGEDPDASDEGDHSDPCDHPGDKGKAGGVAADTDDETHSAGGVAGGGDGGVSASGGVHPGDDNCNCD